MRAKAELEMLQKYHGQCHIGNYGAKQLGGPEGRSHSVLSLYKTEIFTRKHCRLTNKKIASHCELTHNNENKIFTISHTH